MASGDGLLFPAPPFNCTVAPPGVFPTIDNAEIVRVTGVAGDTLTIVRAQEGTFAQPIAAGFVIANTVTAKVVQDIEALVGAAGSGSPEGVVTRSPGAPYLDVDSGEVWIKQTGDGNTGWLLIISNT